MAATIQPREGGKKHIYIFLYCSSTSHALLSSYQYRHTHRKRRSIYPHLTPLTYIVELKKKARCGGDRTSALKSPVPRGPSWWVPFLPSSLLSSLPLVLPPSLPFFSFLPFFSSFLICPCLSFFILQGNLRPLRMSVQCFHRPPPPWSRRDKEKPRIQ